MPLLLLIRRSRPARGIVFAHFLFWYAFLRLFLDLFREYRVSILEIGTGQVINIVMSCAGLFLLVWFSRTQRFERSARAETGVRHSAPEATPARLWARRGIFALLLLFRLAIPSDWTQDIPARYGKRHPGLRYSVLYPRITPAVTSDQ